MRIEFSLDTEYLKQNTKNEKKVTKSVEEVASLINKTDLKFQDLKDILFNSNIFKFEKNSERINESLLGIIKKVIGEIRLFYLLETK